MFPLNCTLQNYAWGKPGNESLVAKTKFSSKVDPSFVVDESANYAELWMGTHPSGPSTLTNGQLLSDYLKSHEDLIGIVSEGYPSNDLPFLFKILSIHTALSIQAHPDKILAEKLHKEFPNIYKDSNHKPEMVIALTNFEAICGFQTIKNIYNNLIQYPEFNNFLINNNFNFINELKNYQLDNEILNNNGCNNNTNNNNKLLFLKKLFNSYINADEKLALPYITSLISRLENENNDINNEDNSLQLLLIRLSQEYPGDIGIFSPLLMNYLQLKPGDSFYIGANEPHAYLRGDCIECMALSDNVVRAGLTPKFKDINTLCEMLTYKTGAPDFLTPIEFKKDSRFLVYRPPITCSEFEISYLNLYKKNDKEILPMLPTASILLLLEGNIKMKLYSDNDDTILNEEYFNEGSVIFIGANKKIEIFSESDKITLYRSNINLMNIPY